MGRLLQGTIRTVLCRSALAACVWCAAPAAQAITVSPGSTTTTVPGYVGATLGPDQFLLPIAVTGAVGLQDWQFDLTFNPLVVQRADVGGFYQGVFGTEFNSVEPVLSSITSGGFDLGGLLDDVAGFSSGVSGNGLLAYIGFEFLRGQTGMDPGFVIGDVIAPQPMPEPTSIALVALGLGIAVTRRGGLRKSALPARRSAPDKLQPEGSTPCTSIF
jgi:hypothetical protein